MILILENLFENVFNNMAVPVITKSIVSRNIHKINNMAYIWYFQCLSQIQPLAPYNFYLPADFLTIRLSEQDMGIYTCTVLMVT